MPDPEDIDEIQPDEEYDVGDPALAVDDYDDFIEVKLPKEFLLEDDGGSVEGVYYGDYFDRDEDTGAYWCSTEGRDVYLRVVDSFDGDRDLRVLDGDGKLHRYRVLDPNE